VNRIHRKVEYALIALKHMSQKKPGQLTTVKEVCRLYGTPFDATSRVLQILVQKSLLKSEQGAHGGYLIQKDLSKVTLFDLIESIVGPIGVVRCLDGDKASCEILDTCNVITPLKVLNDQLADFYKGIAVESLFSGRPKVNVESVESQKKELAPKKELEV